MLSLHLCFFIYTGRDGCAVEFPIRHAEDAGAIAIIFGGEFAVAGFFSTIHDGKATKDVSIPVFEVGRHSYQQLVSELTNGQNVSVQLVAGLIEKCFQYFPPPLSLLLSF